MKIIWANGGTALYAEIVKALEDKGTPWTKNTIITLLSRLTNKGFVKANKTGFRNQYTAIVLEADYQEAQTKTLLDKLYEGSAKGLVSTLMPSAVWKGDHRKREGLCPTVFCIHGLPGMFAATGFGWTHASDSVLQLIFSQFLFQFF